ncbi:radical SAM protein [Pseudodesulfovibrio sp.]|uniref:radical SAM protein n=1 Tax=Pseudodesulfovibrio sp. TaxID=2035812 RepID=UPI002609DEBC|nr:radical SAM protein [Pseudodesulfovibrio sp.]MDD3311614.1 radical SAM protein [Pseudodesulfovibrio sp.]
MTPTAVSYESHPCFGMTSRSKVGRLHLPVAPRANARIRFAPGAKAAPAMLPEEAVSWLEGELSAGGTPVGIVGITGPGDPMATPDATLRTLRMVRGRHPEISLCLTTVGIGVERYAEALKAVGLSHVTLLVDAVDPAVAEGLYAWIRPSTRTMPLPAAARVLVDEQTRAVKALKAAGVAVKVNTTVYPGHNADHVEAIAKTMAGLGADIMAVVPFWPGKEGGEFPATPDMDLLARVRDQVARHINLMPSWEECGEVVSGLEKRRSQGGVSATLPRPTGERPNVAVVSANGIDVDLHLGQAARVLIYGPREDRLPCLLEVRDAPDAGTGAARWQELGELLADCFVLLAASAGPSPRELLARGGLTVMITDGEIAPTVDVLYGGGKGKKCKK